jgi:metal-responsive CopG/Arc/MetJ family transcriptional regulator
MTTIKTAISINEPLFLAVEKLAQELNISRSSLFVMAVERFLQQHQNQKLLAKLNEVYAQSSSDETETTRQAVTQYHQKLVQGEWQDETR